ncbi:MAG: MarR family transcriptional regulator [Clostridia bacterium]|nr:MarR family transcriptional regulator [Clostridia bacterium]
MPSLMRCINIIGRCGAIFRSDRLAGSDLGETHHSYILNLCRNPGVSQDTLAKKLFINKSNVTRTLAYLEAHGYVTRVQSEDDRRVILVYPTEKAYEAVPMLKDMIHGWNDYMTADLSDEEKEILQSILPKLAKRAAEYAELSEEALSDVDITTADEKGPEGSDGR